MLDPKRAEVLKCVNRHVAAGSSSPMKDAALELDMNRNTVRKWMHELRKAGEDLAAATDKELHEAAREGELGFDPILPGFAVTQVKTQQDAKGRAKSHSITQKPHSALEKFEIPEGFELARGTVHVRDDHVIQHWPRYAPAQKDPKAVASEFIAALSEGLNRSKLLPAPVRCHDDIHVTYPLVDLHIGLNASANETGDTDWGTDQAYDTYLQTFSDLLAVTESSTRALVVNSGDFMHFDGLAAVTSRSGHILDTDRRFTQIRRKAIRLFDHMIELALEKHQFVDVLSLPGNHDDVAAGWIALALDMKYRDDPRVNVVVTDKRMHVERHDKFLVGSVHGDQMKMADVPMVVANDYAMDYALSTRRLILTGHIHTEKKLEKGGVRVLSLRTPAPRSYYDTWAGYRSGRSIYSFTNSLDGKLGLQRDIDL